GDDFVGLRALGALDGLDDDVGACVAPRRAERRLLLGARLVLLHPLRELGMTLLHGVVVPGESRRDGAGGRLLAERIELVGVADRGAEDLHLLEEAERPRLLDEGDVLRAQTELRKASAPDCSNAVT